MKRNQKNFLNAAGLLPSIRVGLSNTHFWQNVTEAARDESAKAATKKKSEHYRESLIPYLNKRVQIVSTSGWKIIEEINGKTRICLNDSILIFAGEKRSSQQLRIPTGHMHIFVDNTWLRFVDPKPDEDLLVNGVLYEYVNQQNHRNIGILPVIVTPIENHHKNFKTKKSKGGRKSPQK